MIENECVEAISLKTYSDSDGISFVYVIWNLIRRWRILLCLILSFGIIGGLVGLCSTYLVKLKPTQKKNLETFVKYYHELESQLAYNRNNPLLLANENDVYKGVVSYSGFVGNQQKYGYVHDSIELFFQDEELWRKLYNISGISQIDATYIKDTFSILVESNNNPENAVFDPNFKVVIKLYFLGKDETNALINSLSQEFESFISSIEFNGELIKIGANATNSDTSSIIDLITSMNEKKEQRILSIMNSCVNPNSAVAISDWRNIRLSNAQKHYLNTNFSEFGLKISYINTIAVFSVIGFFLGVFFLVLGSLLNFKVSYPEYISYVLGMKVIACLKNPKKKFLLDKLFYLMTHTRTNYSDSIEYVKAWILAVDNKSRIIICGDPTDKLVRIKQGELLTVLGEGAFGSGLFSNSIESLEKLNSSMSVLFMIHYDYTHAKDLKNQIDICNEMGIKVIGAITIDS